VSGHTAFTDPNVVLTEVHPTPAQRLLPSFATLDELMEAAGTRYADREALGIKKDGVFSFLKYSEVKEQVDTFRHALKHVLGVKRGDAVAVISRNRIEWVLAAYGGYGLGAVNVPMYEQQKSADWEYIVQDSKAKVLIVSTVPIFEKVSELHAQGKLGTTVQQIVCCDLDESHPQSFAHVMEQGKRAAAAAADDDDKEGRRTQPEDLATLIYTSGTTGQPKGVMLTHNNLCSNVRQVVNHGGEKQVITWDDRSLAFLPWAHSYGQLCELHSGFALGASAGIAAGAPGDAAELLANIQEVQPTVLFSVPTLFKKVFDGVNKKIEEEPSPVKRFLMARALKVGHQVQECKGRGTEPGFLLGLQHRFLDKAVLAKMRDLLGGHLKIAVVAGAPTPVAVVNFIESLGVRMTEGYGLTETSPVVSITHPDPRDRVLGTCGPAVPESKLRVVDPGSLDEANLSSMGVEVSAGSEGELWVSGPHVMAGYWGKPEATAEVIVVDPVSGERWFRTGDLVTMVGPGLKHIKVTGRSKEQYKLENGKYVAPAPIENALTMSKFVNQAVLYGSGKPYNVAAVVPDFAVVAEELGITDWYEPEELCQDARVVELLKVQIPKELNERGIKKYEQPKQWVLLSEPFSAENEMLTPKLSVRKPNVIKVYKDRLDALYEDDLAK